MSEFIAEAQVAIIPNAAGFAAALKLQVEKAVAEVGPVAIPVVAAPVVTGANAAALETTAALQSQGIATKQAEVAQASLTRVQSAAAASAHKLAFAQQEVAGASTVVAAAQITFTRSTAAVVAAERERAIALASGNAEAVLAAKRSLELATAQAAEAETALLAARSQAAHAASLAQLGRGAGATGLTFLGLRGATLAASAAFLAGAASITIASKSIGAASDRTEQLNKSVEVFTDSASTVKAWAETTATSIGISETAALSAASTYGELFRTLGVGPAQAAKLSQSLVELAADMASFNNASPERVLNAIQSGLVGQARPLRTLGVFLTEARVKEEALTETGKRFASQLTQQDKILARQTLIFKDAAIQVGDVDRTSGRLANQSRFLSAQLGDLAASIGSKLVPVLTDVVITANAALIGLNKLANAKPVPGGPDVTNLLGWVGGWKELGFVWDHSIFPGLFKMDKEFTVFDGIAGNLAKTINGLRAAFENAGQALTAPSPVQKSDLALALARSTGNESRELALLQQKAARQQAFLESQLGKDQSAKRVALEKKAADNLADTNRQIKAILSKRASDAESAAADQKAALAAAARAQLDATQAFIDSFTGRSSGLQEAISRAADNDNFRKQIALNKAIIANDLKEITALRDRIRHLHLHGEALKAAAAAIQAAQKEIQDARDAITQAQKARKAALEDIINQRLDLRIQLAQARDNVAAEITARTARLANITKQLAKLKNAGKKNTIAWLELKVQQAEEIKAIKDLEGTAKQKQDSQKSLFFTFLQTQQGFAANLLGNLIPGFATKGLVGGSTPEASQAAFQSPARLQQESAVATSRERGVRPVQVDTTNHLLRQILRSLQNLNGRAAHPEARYQKQASGGMMDTL